MFRSSTRTRSQNCQQPQSDCIVSNYLEYLTKLKVAWIVLIPLPLRVVSQVSEQNSSSTDEIGNDSAPSPNQNKTLLEGKQLHFTYAWKTERKKGDFKWTRKGRVDIWINHGVRLNYFVAQAHSHVFVVRAQVFVRLEIVTRSAVESEEPISPSAGIRSIFAYQEYQRYYLCQR